MDSDHLIGSLKLDLSFDDWRLQDASGSRLDALVDSKIVPVLENLAEEYGVRDLEFDSLEIDLGKVHEQDLPDALERELRKILDSYAFTSHKSIGVQDENALTIPSMIMTDGPDSASQIMPSVRRAFLDVLATGIPPWTEEMNRFNPVEWLRPFEEDAAMGERLVVELDRDSLIRLFSFLDTLPDETSNLRREVLSRLRTIDPEFAERLLANHKKWTKYRNLTKIETTSSENKIPAQTIPGTRTTDLPASGQERLSTLRDIAGSPVIIDNHRHLYLLGKALSEQKVDTGHDQKKPSDSQQELLSASEDKPYSSDVRTDGSTPEPSRSRETPLMNKTMQRGTGQFSPSVQVETETEFIGRADSNTIHDQTVFSGGRESPGLDSSATTPEPERKMHPGGPVPHPVPDTEGGGRREADLEPLSILASREPMAESAEYYPFSETRSQIRLPLTDAGLVLIHPFISNFFKVLELTDEKGHFKSNLARVRAVHLLREMTGYDTPHFDHNILLEKVLCGFTPDNLLPQSWKADEHELAEIQTMLSAAKSYWPPLKKSSISALQRSFLQRPGSLEPLEDSYLIRVESSAIDILLEDLPWETSIILLPWLKNPIIVEWQQ